MNKIITRDELKQYCDEYGNFSTERGWWVFGKWVSYDEPVTRVDIFIAALLYRLGF